jgi:expansin (peptidoglycan-binding protein)
MVVRAWGVAAIGAALVGCGEGQPLPPVPLPACHDDAELHRGEASFYGGDGSGACSFEPARTDEERLVAAIGRADNPSARLCGACLRVDGPGGSVVVRVVDGCPGCDPGDLDLSREAFARIAPLEKGRVPITWAHVPCPVSGPMAFRFKDKSNASWTGVQVRNHRYAIASVEYRGRDGAYRAVPRAAYNYFVDRTGMGPGPYELRITDVRGQAMVEPALPLVDGRDLPGTVQSMRCVPVVAR